MSRSGKENYEVFITSAVYSTLAEHTHRKIQIGGTYAREDDEDFKNAVDLLFEELEQKNPNHFAVRQYMKYKLAAGETEKPMPQKVKGKEETL